MLLYAYAYMKKKTSDRVELFSNEYTNDSFQFLKSSTL